MRIKMLAAALLAGLLSLNAKAGFEQFNDPIGGMSVFELDGATWLWYSGWGMSDLRSITTDNRTFELLPNVNAYGDGTDPYWSDGAGDGNKIMEANTLFEVGSITPDTGRVVFEFSVDALDLDARYAAKGFIKVLDQIGGSYAAFELAEVDIIGPGTHLLEVFADLHPGQLLQAGWSLKGRNANPADDWGSVTVTAINLFYESNDDTPPNPDPMSFAIAPVPTSDSEITMTATTATDDNYGVEYLFTNTVNNTSSGWQSSPTFTDTGLSANTLYTYQVKARDAGVNANETAWSPSASATTPVVDNDSPTPAVMSFADTDSSPITVKLTAVTASDVSGVEYYFACTAGGGNDSGWQSSPVYYDTGLTPGSTYSYTVIARDTSFAQNSNTVSAVTDVTTLDAVSGAFSSSLTGFSGSTDDPAVQFELEKAGLTTGSINPDSAIDFGASGAVFGDGFGPSGRNVLKTIATGYQGVSFEAYATLTFSGVNDLSGFIGIGQGIQTGVDPNWGVPELNLSGVNGVVAQFKDGTAGSGIFNCNLFKFISGFADQEFLTDPLDNSTDTIRARLIYDAVAETVNVSFNTNYTGGAFVAHQNMGTVSTANGAASMWDGAPVRVYVGGGEGTVVKDFVIVDTRDPQLPFSVQIADTVPGGVVLSWDGTFGYTYDVEYNADLVDGAWAADTSPGASAIQYLGGSISVTSSVENASGFYRVRSE